MKVKKVKKNRSNFSSERFDSSLQTFIDELPFFKIYLIFFSKKSISTTHNKHIFVRPTKVCLLWKSAYLRKKVLILGSGGFCILGIVCGLIRDK